MSQYAHCCSPPCAVGCHICSPSNRPILYLSDGFGGNGGGGDGDGELAIQDEWDEREMTNLRLARRREAELNARAEIRLWGCDTDNVGAVAAPGVQGGALDAGAWGGAGPDEAGARFVPFRPVDDEGWQVMRCLFFVPPPPR